MSSEAYYDHRNARDSIERLHADMLADVWLWSALLPSKPAWIGDGPVQDE